MVKNLKFDYLSEWITTLLHFVHTTNFCENTQLSKKYLLLILSILWATYLDLLPKLASWARIIISVVIFGNLLFSFASAGMIIHMLDEESHLYDEDKVGKWSKISLVIPKICLFWYFESYRTSGSSLKMIEGNNQRTINLSLARHTRHPNKYTRVSISDVSLIKESLGFKK